MRPVVFKILAAAAMAGALAGCMVVPKPSAEELKLLDAPPAAVSAKIDHFLPRVRAWYDAVEAQYGAQGRALSDAEMDMARSVGVAQPAQLRVVVRRYLVEMEVMGYARSPLELEAYARQGGSP